MNQSMNKINGLMYRTFKMISSFIQIIADPWGGGEKDKNIYVLIATSGGVSVITFAPFRPHEKGGISSLDGLRILLCSHRVIQVT